MTKMLAIAMALAAGLVFVAPATQAQQAATPAQAGTQQPPPPESVDPNSMVIAAMQVVQLIDAGKTADVWEGAAAVAKKSPKNQFVQQVQAARAPLGAPQSRVWMSVTRQQVAATQEAGAAPAGMYISVRFATRFSGGRTLVELVSFRLEENGMWRVAGYALQ